VRSIIDGQDAVVEMFHSPCAEPSGSHEAVKQVLLTLKSPVTLKRRLLEIDELHDFRRIYVMGCGRSGTWLLTGLFSTYSDLEIVPKELGVENFGLFTTKKKALVIKRDFAAHLHIENIPECIEIAYIIRHPFDVLTSYNPVTGNTYHIGPHRWLSEMLALQYLLDSKRSHTTIIKYEDLVRDPGNCQTFISERLRLDIRHTVDIFDKTFNAPPEAVSAMHGLRVIDTNSIGKYKEGPDKIAYLKSILPRVGRLLAWVGDEYGYDVSI
jgi:hypothetical protein